ncbi:hypothetical protein ACVMFA_007327 [Bradyrhizobium liaoningense]
MMVVLVLASGHARQFRPLLYEAAQIMATRVPKWSWFKAWAMPLERLHGRTPRGGSKWAPASVKNLFHRARRSGLLRVAAE